ncbi:hypothetical protein M2375_003202 [Comamonas sp. BIGb0152]|uniref:hypothetical protein n=1 Tax=Comamonas sp. BIGb0152 TaxID=2940601 RepID=UPI002169FD68|nr:hypothetical protein [Comamonas sp. BIGb0152]MCS4294969.1 hypothetical protein [Comamonas sp. BIGb0152]
MKSPYSHLKKYAAIGLLAYAACCSTLASAQSQPTTVVDGITTDFYSSYPVGDVQWRGPAFTTGAVPTQITEITFGLTNVDPTAQATLRLFQLDDTTELPSGAALASASLPIVNTNDDANLNANTYTAAQLGSIPGITLLAHKKYALILSSPSGSAISLSDNDGPVNAYTYSGGFSTAAQGYLQTTDSGTNWEINNAVTPAVRLTVLPVEEVVDIDPITPPTPVPTVGVLGLLSLASIMGLLGLRRMRKSA